MKVSVWLIIICSLYSCNSGQNIDTEVEEIPRVEEAPPAGYTKLSKGSAVEDVICQCWHNPDDMDLTDKFSNDVESFVVIRGYCFYKDGTVLKHPRGYAEAGTWTLEKKDKARFISIKTPSGKQSLRIAQLTPSWLSLKEADEELVKYFAPSLVIADFTKDPFHPSNNKWRMKPSRAESDIELKMRLKGAIHFYVLLYEHFINSEAGSVDFTGYPSPFNWYAGGIYLKKKNELHDKWINCFYNKTDALKAYAFAEKIMETKYKWPKGEKNWLKLNVSVLRQMENSSVLESL